MCLHLFSVKMLMPIDLSAIRAQFPALARREAGLQVIYADGPAGSQVPAAVAQAVSDYLLKTNANHGGCFGTSRESDALLHQAHKDVAALLGVADPGCIIFGNNMTSLTLAFSRSLAKTWKAGDEIILSRCDHDANVTPWVLAAQDQGVTVKWIDINRNDCTLNLDSLRRALSPKTRLVAVGLASNAVGTVHPVREIADMVHQSGAQLFVDAVHYAPHGLIDVPALGTDYLVCSAYKFFGPHVGILYGHRDHLERLTPYKVRPADNAIPHRWMTGTQNHEGITGVSAAIRYLASLGSDFGSERATLRDKLVSAYGNIQRHERQLGERFLELIKSLPGYQVLGKQTMHERVTTFGIVHDRWSAQQLSEKLAAQGIYTWAGNFYALPLTEALGREPAGVLRIGFLHYNTAEEVERVAAAMDRIGKGV